MAETFNLPKIEAEARPMWRVLDPPFGLKVPGIAPMQVLGYMEPDCKKCKRSGRVWYRSPGNEGWYCGEAHDFFPTEEAARLEMSRRWSSYAEGKSRAADRVREQADEIEADARLARARAEELRK